MPIRRCLETNCGNRRQFRSMILLMNEKANRWVIFSIWKTASLLES
jgi:hypothetical protein